MEALAVTRWWEYFRSSAFFCFRTWHESPSEYTRATLGFFLGGDHVFEWYPKSVSGCFVWILRRSRRIWCKQSRSWLIPTSETINHLHVWKSNFAGLTKREKGVGGAHASFELGTSVNSSACFQTSNPMFRCGLEVDLDAALDVASSEFRRSGTILQISENPQCCYIMLLLYNIVIMLYT